MATAPRRRFPAAVFRHGDELGVVASFAISQAAFGIEPFTTLNGGLRVRDVLELRIRVVARRTVAAPGARSGRE